MRFDGYQSAVIDTDDKGMCKVNIQFQEELENELIFYYQLRSADVHRRNDTLYHEINLERFVYQTMLNNTVITIVHVPAVSEYVLEIFANKKEVSGKSEFANTLSLSPLKLKCACKLKIVCRELNVKTEPLPNCAAGEWGPKKAIRHFDILPSLFTGTDGHEENEGTLTITDGFQLKFELLQAYKMYAKLRMNHVEEKHLQKCVSVCQLSDTVTITACLPKIGQYGLDLYACPKNYNNGKNSFCHVCKYLINCIHVTKPVDIPCNPPKVQYSQWGRTSAFDAFGLELVSHLEPKISVEGNNECSITLNCPSEVHLSFQFHCEPEKDNYKYVKVSLKEGSKLTTVQYQVKPPKPGNYMLSLYAHWLDRENQQAQNVYNYLLQLLKNDQNENLQSNDTQIKPVSSLKKILQFKKKMSR